MEEFVLNAAVRAEFGSRAAKKLRGQGRVPANIYGHKEPNALVSVDQSELTKLLDAGHRIMTIRIKGGREEHGVVKDVQYDQMGSEIIHVDFGRVSRGEAIEMEVPVELIGAPKGVAAGGILSHELKEIQVRGRAEHVPEHIEINVEDLEIGDAIRLRDLTAPQNCEFLGDLDRYVVAVRVAKGEEVEEAPEEAPEQPEVIGRKKEEDSEEE